jgi:hypothetical protein
MNEGVSRYAGLASRRTSPDRRTLIAPTVSACAEWPHETQWNFSWVGRFSLAVCPHSGHCREVLRGSTAITCATARPAGLSPTSPSCRPGCSPVRSARSETGLAHRNGDGGTTSTSTIAGTFGTAPSMPVDHAAVPRNSKIPDTVKLSDPVVLAAGAGGRALAVIRSSPTMMKPLLTCRFTLDHSFRSPPSSASVDLK